MSVSVLAAILDRKRREVARRERRHAAVSSLADASLADASPRPSVEQTLAALRRAPGEPIRVIAEIKRRSPSAGVIRAHAVGDVADIAHAYAAAGASAISVLCDGPGFGGSVLDVRRAARAVSTPILFKEFVLAPIQLDFARAAGASMVLLLVRALPPKELALLVEECDARGLVPLVEAAGARELDAALASGAAVIGVNARDLGTFELDVEAAEAALARVPRDRIAALLSGVRTNADVGRISSGRADAILVGTELMTSPEPGARLRALLGR